MRTLASGTADIDAIRTETFKGRTYTVVPVIGLVEGILQGLNAEEPEFAPADEFAKFPMGWNARPITLNHPRRNGQLTSANDPDMLEEFSFGFLANSKRDDSRLKFEAWIDNELVEEKGDEFAEMLQRAVSGEDIIEVSTGLFCEVIDRAGMYNGEKYKKSWANVVPDHLAFLSKGTVGACSVQDGCGAPRLNQELRVHTDGASKDVVTTLSTVSPVNLGSPPEPCCDACAQGEKCMPQTNSQGVPTTPTPSTPIPSPTPPTPTPTPTPAPTASTGSEQDQEATTHNQEENDNAKGTTGRRNGRDQEALDRRNPEHNAEQGNEVDEQASQPPEQVAEEIEANQRVAQAFDHLVANSVDPSIAFENARQITQVALRDHLNGAFVYIVAMTTELCAFERYEEGLGFQNFALNYSIDGNGGVTFTGEPVPVNLLVRIVPREVQSPTANEGVSGANQQQEEDTDMPGENQTGQPPAGTETQTPPVHDAGGEPSANASGAGTPPAPRTLEEFLTDAPEPVREVLQEGIEMRTQKRASLVQKIVANSGGVYTEEELKDESRYNMKELERLEVLSRPKADYKGRVFPSGRTEGINTNTERENQNQVPPAPKAFEKKSPAARTVGTVNDEANAQAA